MYKFLVLLTIVLPFLATVNLSNAEAETEPFILDQSINIEAKTLDPRAVVLKDYLAKHNSPMQDNAQDFIDAADEYSVDWRLVPAIAGTESTFGKRIPGGFNAYGWGVYGTNRIYFKSWKDGIYVLNKGLREKYINKGLTNPYSMNRVYAASPAWGWKVTFFLNSLEAFEREFESKKTATFEEKVAQSSAKLALK